MSLSVRDRADWISTFRFTSVYLMETLARWVPTTAEMEVKLLFGRHLWDFAQHADAFGKRTAALRVAIHTSRRPIPEFMKVLDHFATAQSAGERVAAVYDGIIPVLNKLYAAYLNATDELMDEPSVRIIERVLADFTRMQADRATLRQDRPDIIATDSALVSALHALADDAPGFVDFRPAPSPAEAAR